MKVLCYLATMTILTSQAFAGTILPDLSRSKSEANTSPIAVGFSNRNAANISYGRTEADGELLGTEIYDQSIKNLSASLFLTTSMLHTELTTDFTDDDVEYGPASLTDTSGDSYNFSGSVAAPFADVFSAGVSLEAGRINSLAAGTKSVNNLIVITPAIGMKFLPNMAAGLGLRHKRNKYKVVVVGTSVTEAPTFSNNEFFAGVAYGVDQKIGENGFGGEVVVSHTPRSEKTQGALTVSQGTTTNVELNGNFAQDKLDLGVSGLFSTGDNYAKTLKRKAYVVSARPEYMVLESFYVAPVVAYVRIENSSPATGADSNATAKGWSYGSGIGKRTEKLDLELTYAHGTQDVTPGVYDLTSNTVAARASFYF